MNSIPNDMEAPDVVADLKDSAELIGQLQVDFASVRTDAPTLLNLI